MRRLPATLVVFCGGQSSRMGRDKAFLDWRGRPVARAVAERLGPLFSGTVVSGDPARYGSLGLPCVPDRGGAGPLAGLYATLLAARFPAIFAVACDMPMVEPRAAEELWEAFRAEDAAVPVTAEGPEPMFAFYSRRCLPAIGRALAGRGRMAGWWGECRVRKVCAEALPGGAEALRDCDTVEEYEALSIRNKNSAHSRIRES
jgi:molybdopterin-guanine dinucleotide biosynthesis protein A